MNVASVEQQHLQRRAARTGAREFVLFAVDVLCGWRQHGPLAKLLSGSDALLGARIDVVAAS